MTWKPRLGSGTRLTQEVSCTTQPLSRPLSTDHSLLSLLLVRTLCYYRPLPTKYGHFPHDTPLYLRSFRPHLELRTPPSRISTTDTFSNAPFLCLQVYQSFPNLDKLFYQGYKLVLHQLPSSPASVSEQRNLPHSQPLQRTHRSESSHPL